MKLSFAALAVCLSLVSLPSLVAAEAPPDVDRHWTPVEDAAAESPSVPPREAGPLVVRLELGTTTRAPQRSTLWVVSPLLAARYRLNELWAVGIDWGFVFAVDTPAQGDTQVRAVSGNPLLRGAYTLVDDGTTQLDLWLGVTAPLAWLADGTERGFSRATLAYALSMRGLWDAWLWAPEQIAAAGGGNLVVDASPETRVRVEAAIGTTLPLSDVTQDAADLFVQVASSLELRAGVVWFGLRVQAVMMTSDSDPLQLALAPLVAVDVGVLRLDGRLLINLDEPLGFVGSGMDAWGFLLSAEVSP